MLLGRLKMGAMILSTPSPPLPMLGKVFRRVQEVTATSFRGIHRGTNPPSRKANTHNFRAQLQLKGSPTHTHT